jgi:glycosyltransferase involved in cell wall biosynthesis
MSPVPPRPEAPVAVNGRFLLGLGRARTGVQRAAWNWLRSMAETAPPGRRFLVITGECEGNREEIEELRALRAVDLLLVRAASGRVAAQLWEQLRLPALAASRGARLLVNLANTMPLGPRLRSLLAVMDVSFLERPSGFRPSFRAWYRFLVPAAARKADRVVTISEFSRQEILRRLRLPPGKVEVVSLGVDHPGFPLPPEPTGAWDPPAAPYLLYAGSLEPRKNVPLLLEAFRLLRTRAPDLPHSLLLAGGKDRIYAGEGLEAGDRVHLAGSLPDPQLAACYRGADLFIFPSLYEGFGLPPLEAMASGAPVLISRIPALLETSGAGAETFDPASAADLAALLEKLLRDPEARGRLRARGIAHAAAFRWEAAGRRLNGIIDGMVSG